MPRIRSARTGIAVPGRGAFMQMLTGTVGSVTIPVVTIANPTVNGTTGDVLESAYTVTSSNGVSSVELSGTDASRFQLIAGKIRLLDSSTAGTWQCTIRAADEDGVLSNPATFTVVVAAGTALPVLVMTATEFDPFTIQMTFTNNAAYTSYQAAINSDYNLPKELDATKRIGVKDDGVAYDVQVRGRTTSGQFGPWSAVSNVKLSTQTGLIGIAKPAKRTFDYRRSIAVNAHFNFQTVPVWQPANSAPWLGFLQSMAMQSIRTAIVNGNSPSKTYCNQLTTAVGTRFVALYNQTSGSPARPTTAGLQAMLDSLYTNIGGGTKPGLEAAVMGIELWNEVNNNAGWAGTLTDTQVAAIVVPAVDAASAIYRADTRFSNIPLIGPSVWGRSTPYIDAVVAYRAGGYGASIDAVPVHIYTGGRKPTVGGMPLEGDETGDPNAEVTLDETLADHQRLATGKPLWVTEMGWDSVSTPWTGYETLTAGIITQLAKSKYVSRMHMEMFNRNVVATFVYMLLNNDNQNPYYGLKNQNKGTGPFTYHNLGAFDALANQLSLLADTGGTAATFTPANIDYSFTGTGANSLVHHCLLQKSTGVWWLLVCLDETSYNRSNTADGAVPAHGDYNKTATVNLVLDRSVASIKSAIPRTGTALTTLATNASVYNGLVVPDELMAIEITPATPFPATGASIDLDFVNRRYYWGGSTKTEAQFTTFNLNGSTFDANGLTPSATIDVTIALSGLGSFASGTQAIAIYNSAIPGTARQWAQIDDGSNTNRCGWQQQTTGRLNAIIAVSTVQSTQTPAGTETLGVRHGGAFSYQTDLVVMASDGVAAGADNLATMVTTATTLRIGKGATASSNALGSIARLVFYTTVKTQAEVNAMSIAMQTTGSP